MSSKTNVPVPKIKGTVDVRKMWRLVLLIIVYIFVLALNGLDEFLRSGFDTDFIGSSEWWYQVFLVLTSNIFIFVGTFLYLLDLAIRKRKEIVDRKKYINDVADQKLDPTTFDPFFLNFERDRKINFYKRSMNNRLEKLEEKASMEELELWDKQQNNFDEDGNVKDPDIDKTFHDNKYCQNKQVILKQMDEDFINKHITYMKLKYRPNSKSFVTNGYNNPSNKYDDYAVEPVYSKLGWDLIPKFIIMAGFLIATESVIVEFQMTESWVAMMSSMILKIMPLMLQIYLAFAYCEAYIDEKVMVDLRKRLDIIALYLASLKKGADS